MVLFCFKQSGRKRPFCTGKISRNPKKVRKQAMCLCWAICQEVRSSCQELEEEVWCVLEIEKRSICLEHVGKAERVEGNMVREVTGGGRNHVGSCRLW